MLLFCSLAGCGKKNEIERVEDIEFTVCDESRMPEELKGLIQSRQEEPCKFTFSNQEYLYIVVCYGKQERANMQITVDDLYASTNAIYVQTTLKGNREEKTEGGTMTESSESILTYPYIVIKCQYYDLPVVFLQ